VGLVLAEDQKELTLNSVSSFSSRTVILQAGTNTNYTCSYASGHYSVLNVTGSKSFKMEGGVLKYGNIFLETPMKYYFVIVNGTEGASLCISGVELELISAMNSTVFILGGKVTLEDVKMNNQLNTNWVSPLVYSNGFISSVTVNLHSCTITNSKYKTADSIYSRSAVVYFVNQTTGNQPITFNMSFCSCLNNTFDLDNTDTGVGGGYSFFCSFSASSSMFFFKKKIKTQFIRIYK
jgi:hypothetical protein